MTEIYSKWSIVDERTHVPTKTSHNAQMSYLSKTPFVGKFVVLNFANTNTNHNDIYTNQNTLDRCYIYHSGAFFLNLKFIVVVLLECLRFWRSPTGHHTRTTNIRQNDKLGEGCNYCSIFDFLFFLAYICVLLSCCRVGFLMQKLAAFLHLRLPNKSFYYVF